MQDKTFLLKVNNSRVTFHDNSERVSNEFKIELMKLIMQILESEEVAYHLRSMQFFFDDSSMKPESMRAMYKEGNTNPRPVYNHTRGGIVLEVDEFFMLYSVRGSVHFYNYLRRMLTHELVHYLHYTINKSLEKIWAAHLRLKERYEREYKQFRKLYGPGETLEFLNIFVDKCVTEGFAKFFADLKNNNMVFTQAAFESYYENALKAARKLRSYFEKLRVITKRNVDKLNEFAVFKKFLGGDLLWYPIGLHIIYSIVYFHPDSLDKDIKFLLHKFESVFGRLKPRKVIELYDELMRANGHEPILTFKHSGGVINCREISTEWKRLWK